MIILFMNNIDILVTWTTEAKLGVWILFIQEEQMAPV